MYSNKLENKIRDKIIIDVYKELKKNRANTKYPENFDFEKALTEIFNNKTQSYSSITSSDIIEKCRINPDTRMLEIKWKPKAKEELIKLGADKNIKLPFERSKSKKNRKVIIGHATFAIKK